MACTPGRSTRLGKPTEKGERFLRHLEPLQGALEAYCRRSVRDPGAVEDVLQAAITSAYRDFHLYAEGTNFRAWIFRYLNLEIYAGNRRFRRDQHERLSDEHAVEVVVEDDMWELATQEPLLEQMLEAPERVLEHCDDAMAEAIYELDPFARCVFLLRSIGHFKHREMAEILEAPVGTVMSALSRGRTQLRRRLAAYASERGWLNTKSVHGPVDE